ncbi:MAG: hypothetical protein JNL83_38905 [Myxococcales bacterium]|nr:hypothetical protein [Myxococcales bacterium]
MADGPRDSSPRPAGSRAAEAPRVTPVEAPRVTPADVVPASRPPATPRWLWVAALIAGGVGAIAFAIAAIRGGDAPASGDPPASSGASFPSGLVLGAGIGLAIGWVLGRRAGSSR